MSQITAEDREAVREMLARLLESDADEAKLRRAMETDRGYDEGIWRHLADMDLLGVAVPEERGGIGGGTVDVAMMMEELGRCLVPLPFIETCVVGVSLLANSSTAASTATLAGVLAGETTLAIGGDAPVAPLRDRHHSLSYDADGTVSGDVSLVLHGAAADAVLLCTEHQGQTRIGLVSAEAIASAEPQQANDPALRPARLRFDGASVTMLDEVSAADVEASRRRGVAALAAQQAGAARAIFDITIQYLQDRFQFGRPIGSFQALKHMAADLLIEVESATSAARAAAEAIDAGSPDAERSVALAGFVCADAFREVSAQAIQMHGGIAYTREHVAHLYWRRARAMLSMFGDSDSHRDAYLSTWEVSA